MRARTRYVGMSDVQLFGPMQISSVPSSAPQGAMAPDAGLSGLARADVADDSALPFNALAFDDGGALSLSTGVALRGQVVGAGEGNVLLRFGDLTFEAASAAPFHEGQHLDLEVTGQQQGKWTLQVTGSQLFTAMTEADVTSALVDLHLPASDVNVEVAKTLLSMGMPLQGDEIRDLGRSLAALPHDATSADVAAAVLLRSGALPMTQDNIMLLSQFIAQHPFLGLQMGGLQGALRRLLRDEASRASLPEAFTHALDEVPGLLGELVLDPLRERGPKMQRRLHDLAFQAGIESAGPGGGDDIDLKLLLQGLRERLRGLRVNGALLAETAACLDGLERSLSAVRLLNGSAAAEQGSFYLQIPLAPGESTAEARFRYHVDSQGRPMIDADNAVIELRVPTESLGVVSWRIVVANGVVSLDAAVDTEDARAAIEPHLDVLVGRLEALGYRCPRPTCSPRSKVEQAEAVRGLVGGAPFDALERVDIKA